MPKPVLEILVEDLDGQLHIEHDGIEIRATITSEDEATAVSVVMDRKTARKVAYDLLEMTRGVL